jgi:hypothetical protein
MSTSLTERPRRAVASLLVGSLRAGCVNANQVAMKVGAPPPNAAELRRMQTSLFDTGGLPAAAKIVGSDLQAWASPPPNHPAADAFPSARAGALPPVAR